MSLTPEQIAARKGKLTASRIDVLMRGDKDGIMRLYREMIGEIPEEDLSGVWPVLLGAATEKLQLHWYEMNRNVVVTRRGEVVTHGDLGWAAATLDGWDAELGCPIECKHVGGHEPSEIIIDRYQPQVQWQMMVTGARQCALSTIMGAAVPVVDYVEADKAYAELMINRGDYFMMCVALRQPPVDLDPIAVPCDPTKVIDMRGNNLWAHNAGIWFDTKEPAKKFEKSKEVLKSLVPQEARKCHGAGIAITRDRIGRLHIRAEE